MLGCKSGAASSGRNPGQTSTIGGDCLTARLVAPTDTRSASFVPIGGRRTPVRLRPLRLSRPTPKCGPLSGQCGK